MAKTIQELRQILTDISREMDIKRFDEDLNEHDQKNIKFAADKVDDARQALFNCESQS